MSTLRQYVDRFYDHKGKEPAKEFLNSTFQDLVADFKRRVMCKSFDMNCTLTRKTSTLRRQAEIPNLHVDVLGKAFENTIVPWEVTSSMTLNDLLEVSAKPQT